MHLVLRLTLYTLLAARPACVSCLHYILLLRRALYFIVEAGIMTSLGITLALSVPHATLLCLLGGCHTFIVQYKPGATSLTAVPYLRISCKQTT